MKWFRRCAFGSHPGEWLAFGVMIEIMVRSGHKVGKCFRINCADHVGA